ncbi:MAG TPA: hypothetical protein VGR26_14285 [Acidimicrobiales bacterium]|nr:hypothetical protein [Acidimicrobiales bacterium]
MEQRDSSGDHISGTVTGDVSGQLAIGKDIRQTKISGPASERISEEELIELQQAFVELRAHVAAQAPEASKDPAMARLDELEEAVTAEEPDVTTIEYVKRWFAKNAPGIAGSVVGLLVNPIVGKLVQAAGDSVAAEFNRRVVRR